MTIPQRILTHVALGAGIVIAVATAVTYKIVYEGATQRDLQHLKTYVLERARREEIGFQQVQVNLTLVRGQFLKRMEGPLPRNIEGQWNERFEMFPDGSWRSRKKFDDGRKYSTLWAHKDCGFTPELKTQVLRAQNICDELLPGWVDAFPSVYFVLPGWLNIGFDPRIPSWVWDTPANYNATNLEWFTLAMPVEKPVEAFAWTGVIEEPTTKVPIVSVYLPIVKDGRFLGSIGHDKYLNRLMEETAKSDLPGARHVIFRRDGRIMAHPTKLKEILASKGQLRMQNSGEPELASLYRAVSEREERQFSGYDEASGLYFSVARLAGPEWFFLTTMPRELLQKQAFQSAQWVLWSGLVSLALVLVFLAATLRREVARPLAELTRATKQMSGGDIRARTVVQRGGELGVLANAFNEMAGRVASRENELRQLNQELEQRVAQRTAELGESEARTRALYESLSAAAMVHDESGFLQINSACVKLFGAKRPEEIIGKHPGDVSPPMQPDGEQSFVAAQRHMTRALTEGTHRFEWICRKLDGTDFPVEVTLTTLQLEGRQVMQAVVLDLTDRKRAEAGLQSALAKERELRELKSNFVSLVSHEFRTPLEVIMSSVDNLDRYHERLAPEKRQQLLHTINKSVRRMSDMMEEVLVLGRLETDRMTFKPAGLDLRTFCRRLCDEIESATSKRCPLALQIDGSLEKATGDESLLHHIFTNLLSNAVKYSPAGSSVEFVVRREGENAVCRIADHGCGIPEADQKRLFQAFHRGSNVQQIPGTGLGLMIVQRCVELHGGTIQFESTEGQGATFTVTLPLFARNPIPA